VNSVQVVQMVYPSIHQVADVNQMMNIAKFGTLRLQQAFNVLDVKMAGV